MLFDFYGVRRRSLRVEANSGWGTVTIAGNSFLGPDQGACLVDHSGEFSVLPAYTVPGRAVGSCVLLHQRPRSPLAMR